MEQGLSPSMAVVRTVASHEGVDPVELSPPLHAAIDTDALDAFFRTEPCDCDAANGRAVGSTPVVEFSYRNHRIRVEDPGAVEILDGDDRPGSSTSPDSNHN
ncbi:hypothetical protein CHINAEXTREME_00880 [Halobiforma lacisalsi AJ5]|uniref:Halobacterial output domain-containing protein n=2 Tax=Natronobacterium lacisalsi AJ5 TaxID=358396 RepID=A0A1P8LKS8_NATLA|nr:HalOD1 output domain-containing protein [Halobiforma lacisalsi]APW96402.1 hypothetical protein CHINAEXTREME_00880 [Halobiforma lacisalsi AJ5]